MKQYYGANDISKIIEVGLSKAYEIIRKLKEQFEREYPDAIPVQGRIPIWYFEEKMGLKGSEENGKDN